MEVDKGQHLLGYTLLRGAHSSQSRLVAEGLLLMAAGNPLLVLGTPLLVEDMLRIVVDMPRQVVEHSCSV